MSTLFLTVGGSHEPLLRAIHDLRPDHVVFVCSEDDPTTEKRTGTFRLVEGPGLVLFSSREVKTADLPAIPVLAGLAPDRYEILRVPADDLDTIVTRVHARMVALDPGSVTADYTGGTKSMTAGLALCAARLGAGLSVVVGPRADTIRVVRGEQREDAGLWLNEHLLLDQAEMAWARFDYEGAAALLRRAKTPLGRRILGLSQGYAAWNACRYEEAKSILSQTWSRFVDGRHLAFLGSLTADKPVTSGAALVVEMDLLSRRHEAAGRHDAAVLTRYRAVEAAAQWALRSLKIDAAQVDLTANPDLAPFTTTNHDGHAVISSDAAWRALAHRGQPLGLALAPELSAMRGFARLRNESVLAHGFRPLLADDAARFRDWYTRALEPAFRQQALGRAPAPPQLPTTFPAPEGA